MPAHRYRADIDGLRAIAVLAVVVFHAFPGALPGGFVGVDIFFVLSGYLISGILFEQFKEGRFSYSDFYSRRVRRLFPALILVLLACLCLGWFLLLQNEFERLGKHVLSSVFFVQNLNLLKESGYFDSDSRLKPLLHLWSLSVEEQFYLLWPPVIAFALSRKWSLSKVIGALITISFALNLLRIGKHPSSTFYQIQTRFWELMAGAGLAYLSDSSRAFVSSNLRSLTGLALFALSFAFIHEDRGFPGAWALLPVLGTVLFISSEDSWINRKILSRKALVGIGLISYPLYLWHWPLLSFARILIPDVDSTEGFLLRINFICVFISFVLAYGTYRFWETPIRKKRLALENSRMVLPALVLAFCLIGSTGWLVQKSRGFPNRLAAAHAAVFGLEKADEGLESCKELGVPGVEWCLTNAKGKKPDVVAIGDSHVLSMAAGKNLFAFGTGETLGLLDVGSVVGGEYSTNGVRNLNAAFEWAIKNGARKILLVSRGPHYFEKHGFKIERGSVEIRDLLHPEIRDPLEVFRRGLAHTIQVLSSAGIRVVFVYENPELGFFPQEACYSRPVQPFDIKPLSPCAVSKSAVYERQKTYRSEVAAVLKSFPQVETFDPSEYLCDSQNCYAARDGKLLYSDPNHLSPAGAALVREHLLGDNAEVSRLHAF